MDGRHGMARSILSMRPYWFLRTMAGISMDIGMTLLVINMMMTALGRPVRVADRPDLAQLRSRPVELPDDRAIRRTSRGSPVFLSGSGHARFLAFFEPSARTDKVTAVVRTDLGQLKWMLTRATNYTPLEQRGRDVYLREVAGTAIPIRASGNRRNPPLGPGDGVGRVRFRHTTSFRHAAHRTGPDASQLKYGDEWHYAHF